MNARPVLVYRITLQPKTGRYSLRDGKATLLGVFDTYALAEAEARERFKEPATTWYHRRDNPRDAW